MTTPATATTPRAKTPAKKLPKATKVALKTICAKMGIETKAARRKLRRSELAYHAKRDRWTFAPAQAEAVRKLLASLKAN